MKGGRQVVAVGKGFCVLPLDYEEFEETMKVLVPLFKYQARDTVTITTQAAQILKCALFPANTASFGYFEDRNGQRFHLERFAVMKGEFPDL
jgi:hypothetical protein